MSSSLYSSPYWNTPNFMNGGLQSQLSYMQNQAASNLRNAQANIASGGPAAQSQLAYAQAKQNMFNGFNTNNAQDIQWGNGPLAAGGGNLRGAGMGGGSMGGGGFGGVSNNAPQEPATGWGTGNNGAPSVGPGYNSQGGALNNVNPNGYSGSYRSANANVGDQAWGSNEGPVSFWSDVPQQTSMMYPGGPGASLNRGAVSYDSQGNMIYPGGGSYTPISNGQAASSVYGGYKQQGSGNGDFNIGSGGTGINPYGQGSGGFTQALGSFNQGGSTGASGSGGGSGYRQMDPSGVMQGQVDTMMGYNPYTNQGFGVSNQNNMFNNEFSGGSGGGDE